MTALFCAPHKHRRSHTWIILFQRAHFETENFMLLLLYMLVVCMCVVFVVAVIVYFSSVAMCHLLARWGNKFCILYDCVRPWEHASALFFDGIQKFDLPGMKTKPSTFKSTHKMENPNDDASGKYMEHNSRMSLDSQLRSFSLSSWHIHTCGYLKIEVNDT